MPQRRPQPSRSGTPCLTRIAAQPGHMPDGQRKNPGLSGRGLPDLRGKQSSSRRRGISLLEVLISMFILMIGLLGVGALIPVGRLEVGKGDQYDRAGALGRAAIREIKVRDMLRPDAGLSPIASTSATSNAVPMWFGFDSGNNPFTAAYSPATNTSGNTMPVPVLNGLPFGSPDAFALDPWGFAYNATQIQSGIANNPEMSQFPAGAQASITPAPANRFQLQRITLRAGTFSGYGLMSLPQAARIFQAEDDLVYSAATTGTGAALQQFFPTGNVQKRLSDGNYSWLVTIVPNSPTLLNAAGSLTSNQQYTVSVVVYYKRTVSLSTNVAAPGESVPVYPERVATISCASGTVATTFPGNGIDGGEVQLSVPTGLSPSPGPSYLNVKVGQWIMLSGQMAMLPANTSSNPTPLNPTATAEPLNIYRWYRVVAADDILDSSGHVISSTSTGPYTRNVTLTGPDWPVTAIQNSSNPMTYAFICDGVVAVFEKTMPLERTSPWSTQ